MTTTSKIIEITVRPDGQTSVETKGFAGAACRDASRFIEQALGQRLADLPTSEMYLPAATQESAREGA